MPVLPAVSNPTQIAPFLEKVFTAEMNSPIGRLKLASTAKGLAYIELPSAAGRGFLGWVQRHACGAELRADAGVNAPALRQLEEYFAGAREGFELDLDLRATPFQLQVYEKLAAVGFGQTCSYGELARAVGRPKAARAVGAANGANPIAIVLPCHRVIGSRGQLQGYAGGLDAKARLLAMEKARCSGRRETPRLL